MFRFPIDALIHMAYALTANREKALQYDPKLELNEPLIKEWESQFNDIKNGLESSPEFSITVECVKDGLRWLKGGRQLTHGELAQKLGELNNTLEREARSAFFLVIPKERSRFLTEKYLFGELVTKNFPSTQYDIEEASKCIATARSTAAVFHLMRIMEASVQQFGTKLGVVLAAEKNWQVILDQINKALKAMPDKTPEEKKTRSLYAEAASHLFNVKLAWRNEVMHPKAVYTEEEALDVFNNVRIFIVHFVEKIL